MIETKDVHFDEDSERRVTEEEPKFLEFDTSDDNVIFNDLPRPYDSHKTYVHAESSGYASE